MAKVKLLWSEGTHSSRDGIFIEDLQDTELAVTVYVRCLLLSTKPQEY